MKVLIVDDEEDVRQSIRLLIPWSEYGIHQVLEACDGHHAIDLIQSEKPDIIFTDIIMPGKDGTELLTWLHQHEKHVKTIVISGHDDFKYIQHTLKSGGLDYILKPIDRTEIIKSFENALNNWKIEELQRNKEAESNKVISQAKPAFLDKMFSNLILQPHTHQSAFDELNKEFHLRNYHQCQLAILSTDILQENIIDKFANHADLLDFILLNLCNEILELSTEGYAFKHLNKENEIVLVVWKNIEQMKAKLQKINKALTDILQTPFHFGLSRIQSLPEGLQIGYKEAKLSLRQNNYLVGGHYIHQFQKNAPTINNALFFSDYSEAIVIAIKSNDKKQINKAITKFFQAIRDLNSITLDHLEYWRHEIYLMKSYLFKEISIEEKVELVHKDVYFPLNKDGSLSLDLFKKELLKYCEVFAEKLAIETNINQHIIFDIKRYIDHNYHENLLLQSIADQFYLSREYVSRKFKQEYGLSPSDYIEKIRIENAKILLINHDLFISDVANAVGYQDGRYFSKVFKKVVGVTPMMYKSSLKE